MDDANRIQFGILLITLITLAIELASIIITRRRNERRISTKLHIFLYCQDNARTREQILQHLKDIGMKSRNIDEDCNKTIYEMLSEETLRCRSNGTFKARRNKAKDEDCEVSNAGKKERS